MAEKKKISVAQALLLIKRTKTDLEGYFKAGGNNLMVLTSRGEGQHYQIPGHLLTKDQVDTALRGNWQSYCKLRSNLSDLQRAVAYSNAVTKITFNGEDITIVEAIELRKLIALDKKLLESLTIQMNQTAAASQAYQAELNKTIAQQKQDVTSRTQLPAESVEAILKNIEADLKERLTPRVEDPNDIKTVIVDLNDRIRSFNMDLDFLVNTSNVETMIEVAL